MVCHGGTGTTLGGLAAGVPMVVVPQFADQPNNAARVAATGAGLAIGDGEDWLVTAEEVRAAVTEVLAGPSYRTAATALRDRASLDAYWLPGHRWVTDFDSFDRPLPHVHPRVLCGCRRRPPRRRQL